MGSCLVVWKWLFNARLTSAYASLDPLTSKKDANEIAVGDLRRTGVRNECIIPQTPTAKLIATLVFDGEAMGGSRVAHRWN